MNKVYTYWTLVIEIFMFLIRMKNLLTIWSQIFLVWFPPSNISQQNGFWYNLCLQYPRKSCVPRYTRVQFTNLYQSCPTPYDPYILQQVSWSQFPQIPHVCTYVLIPYMWGNIVTGNCNIKPSIIPCCFFYLNTFWNHDPHFPHFSN